MEDLERFTSRYVEMWNTADAARRLELLRELWSENAANFTQTLEARGYEAIEARVTRSYETYVAPGTYVFRAQRQAASHHNAVKIDWQMIFRETGDVASTGTEFIVLDCDGKIRDDYQFLDA
jgi:hypothetical protein